MCIKRIFSSVTLLSLLVLQDKLAYTLSNDVHFFPLLPRLTLTDQAGFIRTQSKNVTSGDGMLPLFGDKRRIFYGDLQGKTGFNTSWIGSGGLGYRQAQGDARILGGYVFMDRNISYNNKQFWVISPGIESLGKSWDFRINGYIPTSSRSSLVSQTAALNASGQPAITFSGHSQYNLYNALYDTISTGVDGEIGRTVPFIPGLSVFGGAYYFNNSTQNIKGGEARLEYLVNRRFSIDIKDTYDNFLHNTIGLEIKFTLGGVESANPAIRDNIENRIEDPIERNISTFLLGNGTPIEQHAQTNAYFAFGNIWFFVDPPAATDSTITFNSCTFENPCVDFSQNTVDGIAALTTNPYFYFASGSYNAGNNGQAILLSNGESLFGRSNNYTEPATGAALPVFNGSFEVNGMNQQQFSFNAIEINNNATTTDSGGNVTGITIDAAQGVSITNSTIYVNSTNPLNYLVGIYNTSPNNVALNFNQSTLLIQAQDVSTQQIVGIYTSGGVLNMIGSNLYIQSTNETEGLVGLASGTQSVSSNARVNVIDSSIQLTSTPAGINGGMQGIAVTGGTTTLSNALIVLNRSEPNTTQNMSIVGFAQLAGNSTIDNSTITMTMNNGNGDILANVVVAQGQLTLSNSQLTNNFSYDPSPVGVPASELGIETADFYGSSQTTIINSIINLNSIGNNNTATIIGVGSFDASAGSSTADSNVYNSTINVTGTSTGGIYGVGAAVFGSGGATVSVNENSQINLANSNTYGISLNGGQLENDGTTVCNGSTANCNF